MRQVRIDRRGLVVSRSARRVTRAAALAAAVAGVLASSAGPTLAVIADWDITPGTVGAGNGTIDGGSGTWDLTTGNWTTDGGTNNILWPNTTADVARFGQTGGTVTLGTAVNANGLTFDIGGYTVTGSTLTLGGTTPTITVTNAADTATVTSVLAGTGGFTKAGPGKVTITGANTFTGNITLSGGTLETNMAGGAATSPLGGQIGTTFRQLFLSNNATFRTTANFNDNVPSATNVGIVFNFTGAGTLDVASGTTLTIDDGSGTGTASTNAQLQGSGALTKIGAGTLSLGNGTSNFSSYTGAIAVNEGTLNLATLTTGASSLGTAAAGTTVAAGATLNVQANNVGAEPLTIGGTGVSGGGALQSGAGTTGGSTGTVTLTADTTFGGAGNLTLSGVVSDGAGAFNVTKVGTGSLVLSNAANAFDGNVTVNGGAVRGAFGAGIPATANVNLNGGAFEPLTNFTANLGTGPGQVQISGGASGFSAGAAAITVNINGGAQLVWDTTPNFNPSTFVVNQPGAAGTLDVQNAIDLNGATRTIGGNNATIPGTISGVISGNGGVNINGTGIVAFSAANTYTGTTTLQAGSLSISADNQVPTGTPIVFAGGTLRVTGTAVNNFGSHTASYNASAAIGFDIVDPANTFTTNVAFTAGQILNKRGAGTLALGAATNVVTNLNLSDGGAIDIGNNILQVNNGGSTTIRTVTGNGVINASGTGSLQLTVSDGDAGAANGTTLTINAPITGAFRYENFVATNGTGVTVLTNNNSSFSGGVAINSSVLSVPRIGNTGSNSPLGTGGTISITNAGSTLRYTGTGETTNKVINMSGTTGPAQIEMAGTGTLTFTANLTSGAGSKTLNLIGSTAGIGEIAGIIPNNSGTNITSVTKNGTGTWKLSGVNTFTGNVTVTQGNLIVTNNSSLGTGTKTIALSNGTAGTPQLFLDGSAGDITLPNTFTYPTSVNTTATSGAFVNVAGNNTIQGIVNPTSGGGDTGVVVNGGTLTIAANVTTATTGLGTRSLRFRGPGNGVLSGTVTNGSSTVGIVQEGTGTWSITGTGNTYNGATTVTSGRLEANNASGSATGTAAVTVNSAGAFGGTGSITGTLTIQRGGKVSPGGGYPTGGVESLAVGAATFDSAAGAGVAPTLFVKIDPVAVTADQLNVTNALGLSSTDVLDIAPLTPVGATQQTYTIATFGTLAGTFDGVTVGGIQSQSANPAAPNYVLVTYNPTNIQITVANLAAVPEPTTAGLIGLAAVGLLARRRRRA